MEICPNCKAKLNIDEKSSGKCSSCGTTFVSSLPKGNKPIVYCSSGNTIAKAIKICGITIIVLGTIPNFIVGGGLLLFLWKEFIIIICGLVFMGLSEIIQLLEDIKNKLR